MIGTGSVIQEDLFGIAQRIQSIDADYFVFFNYKSKRFEVHCSSQKGNTLAAALPFDRLDARALDYLRKTRKERYKQVLAEMEKENADIGRKKKQSILKSAEFETERLLRGGKG